MSFYKTFQCLDSKCCCETPDAFRFELASELGANPEYRSGHLSSIASREYGAVDGKTVRRMIAEAENNLNRNEGGFKS